MSTRAALFPTVAHALSAKLYTTARSATLRAKLERLCTPNADEEIHRGDVFQAEEQQMPATLRFEGTSSKIWTYLQRQMRKKPLIPRLKANAVRLTDDADSNDEDEDRLDSRLHDEGDVDDLFASQETDEDADPFAFSSLDEEDEDILSSQQADPRCFGFDDMFEDEDVFGGLHHANSTASPLRASDRVLSSDASTQLFSVKTPQEDPWVLFRPDSEPFLLETFDDDADADDDADDDLLLDVMMDERMPDE